MLNLFQHLLPHRVRAYSAQDPDMRQDDSAGKDDSAYKITKEPHKSGSSVFKSSLRNAVINRAPLVEFKP
jgi:hypothetical protein